MNEIQKKELSIFLLFKDICRKEKLNYYAIGGTCIGAVRHNGFIPWDDDIDVAMPIMDYLLFKQKAKLYLKEKYDIIDPNNSNAHSIFMKLQDINTTFIESVELDYPQYYKGVWIDIMPICGIPQNIILKKIMLFKLKIYCSFNANIKMNYNFKNKLSLKSKLLLLICKMLSYKKSNDYWSRKWEGELKKYPISNKYDILFPWRNPPRKPYKNIFPYNYFGKGRELKFETTTICVPYYYDEYLKMDFGDYMKLPPKEKRVTHQDNKCIIDLNNTFIKYKERRRN